MKKIIENGIEHYSYSKLRELQLLQLSLLKIIENICNDNQLQYWIDSGTLLGAIRHKGFIPWDDDLDICLLKEDYDKLMPLLSQECKKDNTKFLKYYKNEKLQSYVDYFCSTEMVIKETNGTFTPCRIDIFPMKLIENLPQAKLEDRKYTDTAHYFMHGNFRYDTNHNQNKIKSIKEATKVKSDFLCFYNDEYMNRNFNKENKSGLLVSYSYGSILLKKEFDYYKYNDIFPLKEIYFEEFRTFIPNNYDTYLKKLYGNYLQLPNVDQRVPFNILALNVEPKRRNIFKEQYLKRSEAYNLNFYFNEKRFGKIMLILFYIRKLGITSTMKGLKITKKLRSLLKQPAFQRVFIKSK